MIELLISIVTLVIAIAALVIAIWNYLEVREEGRRLEEFYNSRGGQIVCGGRSKPENEEAK